MTSLSAHKGFSLVELAIAVTVVGLLMGLAVKGAEVLENAKVASTVLQAKSHVAGIQGFRSEFQAWPGDFSNAEDYIERCGDDDNCSDGDGDGAVGELDLGLLTLVSDDDETVNAWRHLVYSGYGAGIPSGEDLTFGEALPSASVNGGFELYFMNNVSIGGTDVLGHMLRLSYQSAAVNDVTSGEGYDGFVAYTMDAKLDDGDPTSGDVMSVSIDDPTCEENSSRDCVIYIRVDGL